MILVTGASGYVGAYIYDYLKKNGYDVTGTYHSNKLFKELIQLDLTNENQVKSFLDDQRFTHIIHIAANASNASCEEDPKGARDLNVQSTRFLTKYSKDSKFIFISTFAVYNPNGVYGKTKLEAEELISKQKDYVILRPSLIIGLSPNNSADRPFNRILRNIDNSIKAVYDSSWEFQVTYLKHLAEIIKECIEREDIKNKVIPVVSEGKTSRYQIAKDILSNFNIIVDEIDDNRTTNEPVVDFDIYKNLELPYYTYKDTIALIVKEIKQWVN